jgi:hypothetical protein
MNTLLPLWLPILLSAVVVFIISCLVHMVFKWHAADYKGFANEDAVRDAIRAGNPAPGRYVVPYCADMKDMAGEAMAKKYQEGPVGHMTIGPTGMPVIGKFLGQWFAWCVVAATLAVYLAWRACGLDPVNAARAGHWVATITFIAHGAGTITESIWMMRPWSVSVKYLLDSALYAAGAGLVSFWVWP